MSRYEICEWIIPGVLKEVVSHEDNIDDVKTSLSAIKDVKQLARGELFKKYTVVDMLTGNTDLEVFQ